MFIDLGLTRPGSFFGGMMSLTPVNSTITVATAGTRVQATTDVLIKPTSIYFEAAASNTGYIYVGVSTVSSTQYIARLSPGQGLSFRADTFGSSAISRSATNFQLSDLYVDSSVSGEKVLMSYLTHG